MRLTRRRCCNGWKRWFRRDLRRPPRRDRNWPRKPVREYLLKQGRFAHFTEEDLAYFQSKVDEMWTTWEIPGIVPFKRLDATKAAVAAP